MIGFAIVGCGMIARVHASALAEAPGARVSALVSRDSGNARSVAAAVGADCVIETDLQRVLGRQDVHAVIITTPTGAHLEPAVAAANAGKHVLVEKPLEINLERCDRIIDACERAGVKLGTIFQSRFSAVNQAIKSAVDGRRLGRLTMASTTCKWWRPQSYYDGADWRGTRALDGGGALLNQAIHNVDLLTWLMGPVTHVSGFSATLTHERIEVEDTAVACFRFASGALGVIEAATSTFPGLPKTISIHGDRGTIVVEEDAVVRWDVEPLTPEDQRLRERSVRNREVASGASNPAGISHVGHARQLVDLVNAIENNRAPLVDGNAGRTAVAIALGIYRSAASGRVVQLSE